MDNSSFPPCFPEDCENSTVDFIPPPVVDYIQAAITLVIIVASMTVNLLIVYLVVRSKILRQRAFLLALLLVTFNLCYTVVPLPIVFVSAILRRWVFGDVACLILGGINDAFFSANFITMFVLTLDRFFTIFMPFYYNRHGNKIAIGMSFLPWIVAMLSFIINGSLECFDYSPTAKVCVASGNTGTACTVSTTAFAWGITFAGIIVPIVLYTIMYVKGRQLNKQLVISEEMKAKGNFNKRIFRTFLVLLITLVGVSVVAAILFTWLVVRPRINQAFYIVQVLVGRTLASGIAIAHPIIILLNRDVREAWKKHDSLTIFSNS